MLALEHRLTANADFLRTKRLGKLYQSDSFTFLVYNRNDINPSRFGFVISANISKNASKRNYIKRALGEAVRQNVYSVKPGYDCVFLVKVAAAQKYTADLMPEVVAAIKKAKMTK